MSPNTASVNSSGLPADSSATDQPSDRQSSDRQSSDQQSNVREETSRLNAEEAGKSNAGEDANKSNEQTIDAPDENACELSWATRNEIILIVNEYSKFLFSGSIAESDKKKLTDRHFELYRTLASLPLEGTGSPDEVVLQLDFDLKSKIVNSLLINHNLAVVCPRSASSKRKLQVAEENNDLLSCLLKLPVKKLKASNDSSETGKDPEASLALSEGADDDNELVKRSEMNEMNDQVVTVNKQIGDLIDVIDGLQKTVQSLDVNRPEAFFSYEFSNIRAFLGEASNTRLRSDFWYCRGKQFYLMVNKTLEDYAVKHVGIYVYAMDADLVNWHLDVSYEICLLNQRPGGENRVQSRTDQRIAISKMNKNSGSGIADFITPSDLIEHGFLKDDKIIVQINLKADRLNRSD